MKLLSSILHCMLFGYLVGCISPSFLIGKKRGYDPRESGSGNAGASNTIIMAGKRAGLFVALLDIFKAALCWRLAPLLFPRLILHGVNLSSQLAGVACILGHMFPVFLGFRGGKGFACLGGCVIGYRLSAFIVLLCVALLIAYLTNYVYISTCSLAVIWPAYYGLTSGTWLGALILLAAAPPIILRHQINYQRMLAGQELRFSYLWQKKQELERLGIDAERKEKE